MIPTRNTREGELRVGYVNVRGLSIQKLQHATQWISQGTYDIIFLAETWFSQEKTYRASQYFVDETTKPAKHPKSSRYTGGILTLASQHIKQNIQITKSEYFITVTLPAKSVTAVYLPPSLPIQEFQKTIKKMIKSDILIGDFNCIATAAGERPDCLRKMAASHGLHLASTEESHLDHIWTTIPNFQRKFTFIPKQQLPFSTDHGFLGLSCLVTSSADGRGLKTRRYFLKQLEQDSTEKRLIDEYEKFRAILDDIAKLSESAPLDDGHEWVESFEEIWRLAIQNSCELVLGSYEVEKAKNWEDKLTERLGVVSSMTGAVRTWKRAQRGKQPRVVATDGNNSVIEEAIRIFSNVYDSDVTPSENTNVKFVSEPHSPVIDLVNRFSPTQLKKIIKRYPKTKSCGPDGIHAKIFDSLCNSENFLLHFSSLCKLCVRTNQTPSSWNTSNTFLLAKDNGDECLVTRTRPVSLTNMARRYFESILLSYLDSEPAFKLHRNQAGFKRGFSTISQILVAHESSTLPARQKHLISIYLDLEKAFDRLQHKPLLQYLRERNCPESIIRLLYSLMMHNCRSHLIINGHCTTSAIRRNRGVFQGSILAPLLFNVAMDSLAHELDSLATGDITPLFLLFADDIRLSSHSSDSGKLNKALRKCEAWAERFGLTFGIKKCGVMGEAVSERRIQGKVLPVVDTYKYLGIDFNTNGIDWSTYWDRVLIKAESTLKYLFVKATPDWAHSTRLALVKSYVLSLVQYGLGLFGHWKRIQDDHSCTSFVSRLDELHYSCLEFVFGFQSPRSLLESMSNLKNASDSITLAMATTTRHVQRLSEDNPVRDTKRNIQNNFSLFMTHSHRSLLIACFNDPLFLEWKAYCDDHRSQVSGEEPIGLKKFILKKFEAIRLKSSVLVSYISSSSRTPTGNLDLVVLMEKKETRELAVKWRCNKVLIKKYCGVCMKEIGRTHVNECLGLQDSGLVDSFDWTAFEAELTRRRRRYGSRDNITFLDFLLNHQMWDKFVKVLNWLLLNSE